MMAADGRGEEGRTGGRLFGFTVVLSELLLFQLPHENEPASQ